MVDARGGLRMVLRHKGKRITYSLGYSVDAKKWNKDTQRCKRNTTHGKDCVQAARINAEIQRYEDSARNVADGLPDTASVPELKKALDVLLHRGKEQAPAGDSFFDLYHRYIEEESKECGWSMGTIRKMDRLLREWLEFDKNMELGKINEETLNKFREYQILLGHQNETVKKKLSMSKWFFRWLVSKGILKDVSFTTYRAKLKKASKTVVFLTWDELMKVYTHQFQEEKKYLTRVRDVFCFCCFTSLRYSDVHALRKSDIADGCITITTKKTNDKLRIELNKYSEAILSRYKELEGEKALPVISNQKMNEYLKEVCFECGIDEPVTDIYYVGGRKFETTKEKWEVVGTHCGRRTFICNALMMGIPPNIVMKWTGHSDYKAMKPYIDISDKAKGNAMRLFDAK